MSTFGLVRAGVATIASFGGAVGGFSVSQSPPAVVDVAAVKPPIMHSELRRTSAADDAVDLQRWAEAFMAPATAPQAQASLQPWLFVGVVGDGKGARAVFSSPEQGSMETVLAQAGDTLPDGRVIAAVASSNVLFAAPAVQGPLARALASAGAPARLALFSGEDQNAKVVSAYAEANQQLGMDASAAPIATASATPAGLPTPPPATVGPRLDMGPSDVDQGYKPPGVLEPASAPGAPS
jgi:hypothetical protein